jgi:DNA polymerase (family 10)
MTARRKTSTRKTTSGKTTRKATHKATRKATRKPTRKTSPKAAAGRKSASRKSAGKGTRKKAPAGRKVTGRAKKLTGDKAAGKAKQVTARKKKPTDTTQLPPPIACSAKEIGDKLAQVGAVLEILGENVFKVRAYENAARILPGLGDELPGFIERNELPQVQGIGKGIAERVEHLARYGSLDEFDEITSRVPPGLLEMLRIPGLGPKKVKILYDELDIVSVDALESACHADHISTMKGFGRKTQENILTGIAQYHRINKRFVWIEAWEHAQPVYEALRKHPAVDAIEVAGSLRRKRETVKDVDLVVSTRDPEAVSRFFAEGDWTERLIGSGTTKTSIVLKSGLQVDLRVVTAQQFPHALHHFTGSKDHNVAMRGRAQRMGYKINEYGLFHGDELIVCQDEAEIYRTLGLDYVPPELREDLGEVQAAEEHTLPRALVEWSDLRGALHVHSTAGCGNASVGELLEAAEKLGWTWLGIADVTQAVDAESGLRAADVPAYLADLRAQADRTSGIQLLCGISVAIDARGNLDLPGELLQLFDYVIAGVHEDYDLDAAKQTKRLLKAVKSGVVSVLAHPLARLLGEREPLEMDFSKVVAAAVQHGVLLEINGDPHRMDLDGQHAKHARDRGGRFVVEPDAHSVEELRRSGHALGMARRGWLGPEHIVNTESAEAVTRVLQHEERKERVT